MPGHTPNPLPTLPRPTKAYHKTVYPYISPDRPELNVSGKTLFITGGGPLHTHTHTPPLHSIIFNVVKLIKQNTAGGIGRGICKAFAQAGISRIIIIGRTPSTLTVIKNELETEFPKIDVTVHAASVTDSATTHSIIRATGKIDIVVSAAAICHTVTPPSTIAPSELSEILHTNTVGPFSVISAILHERAVQGWTHEVKVVYVSSALSHTHICHLSAYAASKAAMNLLCLHLNMEWNARGVSIFAIHPGLIYTTLTGKVFPKDSPIWEDGDSPPLSSFSQLLLHSLSPSYFLQRVLHIVQ